MDKADRRSKYITLFGWCIFGMGFEFQSRYIALRMNVGKISPVIRNVV